MRHILMLRLISKGNKMRKNGCLVLGRYCGESIMIGNDVRIMVKSVDNDGRVRLEIDAPKDIPVDRIEIWGKKRGVFQSDDV